MNWGGKRRRPQVVQACMRSSPAAVPSQNPADSSSVTGTVNPSLPPLAGTIGCSSLSSGRSGPGVIIGGPGARGSKMPTTPDPGPTGHAPEPGTTRSAHARTVHPQRDSC